MIRTKQLSHNSASALITGVAAVLLLFISISTPVVNSMRMYRISNVYSGAIRYVDVGLYGYCVQPLQFGFNNFIYDPTVQEGCSIAKIGFSLDSIVADALKTPELNGLYSKAFTGLLVLFPIATVLSAFLCILQLGIHLLNKTRSMQVCVSSRGIRGIFFFNVFALFIVFFAFIIQIAVLITGRARVNYLRVKTSNYNLRFHGENTPWLSGFALLMHLIDLLVINRWRKERMQAEKARDAEHATKKANNKAKTPKQKKGKKGQKTLVDEDTRSKDDAEIIEGTKEEAIAPPEYHLDGYTVDTADSKKV